MDKLTNKLMELTNPTQSAYHERELWCSRVAAEIRRVAEEVAEKAVDNHARDPHLHHITVLAPRPDPTVVDGPIDIEPSDHPPLIHDKPIEPMAGELRARVNKPVEDEENV